MNLRSLVPWGKRNVPVRKADEQSIQVLHRDMNALFNELLSGLGGPTTWMVNEEVFGDYVPSMDMHETDKELVITAELAGMDEKDVDLCIARDVLTISGEKKSEKKENIKGHYKLERSFGMFRRSIPLPAEVIADSAIATFKNGLLTITMQKNLDTAKSTKSIPINQG